MSRLIEQRADERKVQPKNRELRLALWQCWDELVQEHVEDFDFEEHLVKKAKRCARIKKRLQAEVDEAAESKEEDGSGE